MSEQQRFNYSSPLAEELLAGLEAEVQAYKASSVEATLASLQVKIEGIDTEIQAGVFIENEASTDNSNTVDSTPVTEPDTLEPVVLTDNEIEEVDDYSFEHLTDTTECLQYLHNRIDRYFAIHGEVSSVFGTTEEPSEEFIGLTKRWKAIIEELSQGDSEVRANQLIHAQKTISQAFRKFDSIVLQAEQPLITQESAVIVPIEEKVADKPAKSVLKPLSSTPQTSEILPADAVIDTIAVDAETDSNTDTADESAEVVEVGVAETYTPPEDMDEWLARIEKMLENHFKEHGELDSIFGTDDAKTEYYLKIYEEQYNLAIEIAGGNHRKRDALVYFFGDELKDLYHRKYYELIPAAKPAHRLRNRPVVNEEASAARASVAVPTRSVDDRQKELQQRRDSHSSVSKAAQIKELKAYELELQMFMAESKKKLGVKYNALSNLGDIYVNSAVNYRWQVGKKIPFNTTSMHKAILEEMKRVAASQEQIKAVMKEAVADIKKYPLKGLGRFVLNK